MSCVLWRFTVRAVSLALLTAPHPQCNYSLVSHDWKQLVGERLPGIEALYVSTWAKAAEELGSFLSPSNSIGLFTGSSSTLDRLQAMQTANLRTLKIHQARLQTRVAAGVCAAAGAPLRNELKR